MLGYQDALRTAAGPRARLSAQYRYNQLLPPFAEDALLAASLLAVARRTPEGVQGACGSHSANCRTCFGVLIMIQCMSCMEV